MQPNTTSPIGVQPPTVTQNVVQKAKSAKDMSMRELSEEVKSLRVKEYLRQYRDQTIGLDQAAQSIITEVSE